MQGHYGRYFTGQSTLETYHAAVLMPESKMYTLEIRGKNFTAEQAALMAVLQLTGGKSSENEVRAAGQVYKEHGGWKQFTVEEKTSGNVYRVAVVHTNTRHF